MKQLFVLSLLILSVLLQSTALVTGETNVILSPIVDSYSDSKYPKMMYGAHTTFLYVGNSFDHAQNLWGSERIYIRFDLTALPKDHVILQATLHLWQYYAPDSAQTLETHRVLANWGEGTLNWDNQPPSISNATSIAVAPSQTEVAVEWDITNDAKAWYGSETPNYGTMIKVAKEEQVSGASSGFWSREYPTGTHEQWKPKLIVRMGGGPTTIYTVSVGVTGLPVNLATNVTVDGYFLESVSEGHSASVVLDVGTTHTITVTAIVPESSDVRYVCTICQASVSNASLPTFSYAPEYLVTITTEPKDLFQTPESNWYKPGTVLSVKRTGEDLIQTTQGSRLVFDGWYVNGQKMIAEPKTIVIDGPTTLLGRYRTEYFLNVTTPFGVGSGTGWYAKDSVASFSVVPATIPAPGLLGVLGVRKVLSGWVGSGSFLGVPNEDHGSILVEAPITITATWRDDWGVLLFIIPVLFLLAAIACGIAFVRTRRRRPRGSKVT